MHREGSAGMLRATMTPAPTETILTPFQILLAAEREGIDASAHFASLGLTRGQSPDFRAQVSQAQIFELWQSLMRERRDPTFPVRAARIPLGQMGSLLAFLCCSSPTVRDAARQLVRYWPMVSHFGRFVLEEAPSGARLMLVGAPLTGLGARCHAEFCLADLANCTREGTRSAWAPDAVSFAHPAPSDISAHHALFGAVSFGQSWTGFTMSKQTLDVPFFQAAPALANLLEEQAAGLLSARPSSTAGQVQQAIRLALERGGSVEINRLAASLGVGPRTLQRRLREEGVHFQTLLDDLRKERAAELLLSPGRTLKEIAAALGFADVRSFHRAHLRWTGSTPRQSARPQKDAR